MLANRVMEEASTSAPQLEALTHSCHGIGRINVPFADHNQMKSLAQKCLLRLSIWKKV